MGKENGAARKPPASRHSKSMRMERGHIADTTPARSQSFGAAAASRIRPLAPHPSPAELERKHSQIIRKPSRIFAGRPVLRTPRLDHASSIFSKLQSALSDYGRYLEEALESVEPKRKRIVEQRIKLIDSRLQQIDEIFQLYLYEQKMREGSRNLLNALTLQGSKGGQDKCRTSFNNCTEKMCAIEEELESKLGVFRFQLNALLAFGRLCSGDVYDVHIKHGTTFKWKSRCKVESREGQKWIDDEFTFRPSITDALSIRVIEMRKIQANVQIGNVLLHTRNYIKARPQIVSVPLNSTGSMKLKVTIEWRPFSGKEENTLRSKRQSLLSEVIFIPATPSSSEVSGSSGEDNRPDVVERETAESLLSDENPLQLLQLAEEDVTLSSEVVDAGLPLEVDGMIVEEPQDFRHATSLDGALQHLIPTLQTYKDQFPELQNLIALLERLEEIVKKCTLSRSSMSLSVESALESFDFLEQDTVDEANTTPRSTASGGSGCHDTGYNSTDDYAKDLAGEGTGESHDYIVDFMTTEKAVENHVGDSDENDAQRKIEEDVVDQSKSQGEENQSSSQGSRGLKEKALGTSLEELGSEAPRDAETTNHNSAHGEDDSPSCLTDIFPSASSPSPAHKSQSLDETGSQAGSKEGASSVPSAVNSPGKKLEAGSTELSEHSSSKARSSRATSPNLSSAFSQEATVGHKVLDKVLLSHLQFCEEVSGHLGSFGPMKSKEMSALSNLRRQSEVLERLVNFIVSTDPVDSLTLQQINPRLVSSAALCSLWERSFQGSPLFTTAGALVSGFEDNYKKQIIQSYNRVSDVVFPVIVARVIHQDPDLTDVHAEEEDVVSVFQFEYYFMDYCRRNLSKYIDEVAYELVISKRLLSPEKDAVTAQLKQYTEIPLSKTCFNTVLCLLLDGDIVAQAAEAYLVNLHKNADLRKKAISLSIEALEESEERLREGACVAITVLQARDSVPQLLYLSRCDVQSVKFAARKALSALGEEGEDALRMSTMSSSEIAGLMF